MLASGLVEDVDDAEELARFVDQSGKKNAAGATWRAFVPPHSGELSSARCGNNKNELVRLAKLYLKHENTLGAAIFSADSVRKCGLDVKSEEPPERHCNICGWPSHEDQQRQWEIRKQKAMELFGEVSEWVPFL